MAFKIKNTTRLPLSMDKALKSISSDQNTKLLIEIPISLKKEFHRLAIKQDTTMKDLINNFIVIYVDENRIK